MNSTAIVETNYGLVQGVITVSLLNNVFYSYLGIPYAKPPIGELRFKDPQFPEPWSGVWNATEEPESCWERDLFSGEYRGSEDCLYLNVFTHQIKPRTLKPVIVFIYAGAFNFGSASLNLTGPDYIMQKDVVLVTFNFRQAVFGYLRVPDDSFNISGNFGLKDQSFALRWVKENIRNFGGDPNNVLLFGYSSGACAVNYQMLSEWSRDLFHKAIVMSGSVLNTRFATPANESFYVERLAAAVGWDKTGGLDSAVNILRNANASEMIRAQFQPNFLLLEDQMNGVRFPYGPVIESKHSGFMPVDPRLRARNSWSNNIPVILTNAADEALILRPAAAAKGDTLLSTTNFDNLIPKDTGRSYCDGELKFLGEKIRNLYFGDVDQDTSQEKILDNFVRMESDRLYVHGMYRLALSRLRHRGASSRGTAATYMYRFNVDSPTMNLFRILRCGRHCNGTAHTDDLSYIFRNFLIKSINDIGESEMAAVSRVVNIIYNFATRNDPNLDVEDVCWQPLNEQLVEKGSFDVLDIGQNLTIIELPELKAMQLWSSFYDIDHLT